MSIRKTLILALPVVLTSSLALAQQQRSSSTTSSDDPQKEKKSTGAQKAGAKSGDDKADKKDQDGTTILGQEIQNEDEDLDVKVGKTQTTAAEPARPDVIESRAEERREVEGRRINIAPLFGFGTGDYNVGIGARAGYTFETPVYVGGTFMYHFGEQTQTISQGLVETQSRFYYPGAEVGYDIGAGPVLIRPYGGAGVLFGRSSITTGGLTATDTQSALMLYPGVTAQYIFPRSPVFVGGDARILIPLANHDASLSLFATTGLTL